MMRSPFPPLTWRDYLAIGLGALVLAAFMFSLAVALGGQ